MTVGVGAGRGEPLAVGLASFLLLCWLGPSDVWLRDAGQLSAAAWTLGVPHPTGFPVVMMLGRLATLVPVGPLAWKIALLSAACAATAAGLVAATALAVLPPSLRRTERLAVAAIAAAALLASPTWWLHAVAAEVYAPTALALALGARLVVAAVAAEGAARLRLVALLGLLTGLSTGFHVTGPLLLAAMWAPLLVAVRPRSRPLLAGIAAASAGSLVQGYLLAAAAHDPWRNWGDPSTPARALAHATGSTIRRAFGETIGVTHPIVLQANLEAYGAQLADGLGWALLLAGVGLAWCLRARGPARALGGALALAWLADAAFTALVNPMGIVDRQTGVPSLGAAAALIAVGAGALVALGAERWERARARLLGPVARGALAALLAVVVVGALSTAPEPTWASPSRPRGGWAELWGRAALAQAPPGALVATASDDTTGVLTWLLGAEGARPDVAHVPLAHVYDPREVAHWRRLYGAPIPEEATRLAAGDGLLDTAAQQRVLVAVLRGASRRRAPVLWEPGMRELDRVLHADLRPGLPLWWPAREGAEVPTPLQAAPAALATWERLARSAPDAATRRLVALHLRSAALVEVDRGRPALATALLVAAAELAPRETKVLSNLTTLLARAGRSADATALARRLVERDPAYVPGRLELAGLLLAAGERAEAQEHARAAASLATRPGHLARAHVLLGRLALAAGDTATAAAEAAEALRHRPGDAAARELERQLGGR